MIRIATETEIDRFIGSLSDEQFRECVVSVIKDNPTLTDDGRKVLLRFNPYKSPMLRRWVFDSFAGPVAPKPHWPAPQIAADFEV